MNEEFSIYHPHKISQSFGDNAKRAIAAADETAAPYISLIFPSAIHSLKRFLEDLPLTDAQLDFDILCCRSHDLLLPLAAGCVLDHQRQACTQREPFMLAISIDMLEDGSNGTRALGIFGIMSPLIRRGLEHHSDIMNTRTGFPREGKGGARGGIGTNPPSVQKDSFAPRFDFYLFTLQ